jgi:hypothetical protein
MKIQTGQSEHNLTISGKQRLPVNFHKGHDVLILEVEPHHTFIMPLREAELIYQRQGYNAPVLF